MKGITEAIESLPVVEYAAGDVIIEEGRPFSQLLFLAEGEVTIAKQGQSIAAISAQHAVFGEVSCLLGNEPMATVKAKVPTRMYAASDPTAFFQATPMAAMWVAQLLAERLSSVSAALVDVRQEYAASNQCTGKIDEVLDELLAML